MHIYKHLLKLDGPVLVSDSKLTKIIKRKILKPIGYYFRKLNYDKFYKKPDMINFKKRLNELIAYNIDCNNMGMMSIANWQLELLKDDYPLEWQEYRNSDKAKEQASRGKFLLEH